MRYPDTNRLMLAMTVFICIIGLTLAASPAEAQGVRLDVQANISAENVLHFEGTVTPQRLSPEGRLQVRNEVDILVETICQGGRFRELPDRYHAAADEAYRRGRLLEGEQLEGRESTLIAVSGQSLDAEDEDERFGISGMVELGDAVEFRIIARLQHTWVGSWPASEYYYDIAGNFPVREGIARKRRGGGFLGDVGRFLERGVCDVGKLVVSGVEDAGKFLLGGGDNTLSLLQLLLLGDLEQRGGALGQAIRIVGGASGAGIALYVLEQIVTGETRVRSDDLTRTVIEGLVEKHIGDGTVPSILLETGGGGLSLDHRNADALINSAMLRLQEDLTARLGLRDVRVDLDASTAVITSQMPGLEGRGHLEPIIAYMLVDAALAAPWTEVVTAVFDDDSGDPLSISVAADVARMYARGDLDTDGFLQLCRFTDALELSAAGDAVGPAGPSETAPAEKRDALLAKSRLPAGWMASATHPVEMADLDVVIPDVALSEQPAKWAALQVVQVEGSPVTLLGLEMPNERAARDMTRQLATEPGGEWDGALLRLETDPPLYAMHRASRAYLLQGEEAAIADVARLMSADAAGDAVPSSGLAALLPAVGLDSKPRENEPKETPPAAAEKPQAEQTPADAAPDEAAPADEPQRDPVPEAVSPARDSFLRDAYLCTGLDGSRPEKLSGALPAGSERLGVYLDIRKAPANTVLNLELWRDGERLGRRLIALGGDRRTVTYFMLDPGFGVGTWWLEITTEDELLARLPFEVQ